MDVPPKKRPISKYISSDFLESSEYLGEIIETLENLGTANERCTVCDENTTTEEYSPCCSSTCAREAYAISSHLEVALRTLDFDTHRTPIVHIQDKAAEHAMNLMLAIVLHSTNAFIQIKTRRVLLLLSKNSQHVPSSLFIKDASVKIDAKQARGGYATVYIATYQGVHVAVKEIFALNLGQSAQKSHPKLTGPEATRWYFRYEALIWKTLRHARIMPLLGIVKKDQDSSYMMVSPWCYEGSVRSFLNIIVRKDKEFQWGRFYRILVYRWLLQVIEGLKYLHSQGVAHGDLHAGNILVTNARPGVTNSLDFDILLSDFGLSVIQDANSRQFASLRAGLLRAPEQLAPDKYGILDKKERPTAESDIFTFAALCYELYTTKLPYATREYNHHRTETAIVDLEPLDQEIVVEMDRQEIPVRVPDPLWEIIEKCWKAPGNRPTLDWIEERLRAMQRPLSVPPKQT